MNRDTHDDSSKTNPDRPLAGRPAKTPSADLQPEDTGTPASGNTEGGSDTQPATKQTSKTSSEAGGSR